MVMLSSDLALNPEFEGKKEELKTLRKGYIKLVEEYTNFNGQYRDQLESEYMMQLGGKEYQLFLVQVEILRVRREISLYQAARNRKETISRKTVESILEREFQEYQEKIEFQQKKMEWAKLRFSAEKLSAKESMELKKLYRELVRKLHPDLNPELPPESSGFWQKTVEAYNSGNLPELRLISGMVKEYVSGVRDPVEETGALEQLEQMIAALKKKKSNLKRKLTLLRKEIPFVYESLLNDPAAVLAFREELEQNIKSCQERLPELKQHLKELIGE